MTSFDIPEAATATPTDVVLRMGWGGMTRDGDGSDRTLISVLDDNSNDLSSKTGRREREFQEVLIGACKPAALFRMASGVDDVITRPVGEVGSSEWPCLACTEGGVLRAGDVFVSLSAILSSSLPVWGDRILAARWGDIDVSARPVAEEFTTDNEGTYGGSPVETSSLWAMEDASTPLAAAR